MTFRIKKKLDGGKRKQWRRRVIRNEMSNGDRKAVAKSFSKN